MLKHYFRQSLYRSKSNRPFIVPLKFAYAFAALNFLFFLIALTYMSNILLLYLFFLVALGFCAMHAAHFNMLGLRIKIKGPDFLFAKEAQNIAIEIENVRNKSIYDLELSFHEENTIENPVTTTQEISKFSQKIVEVSWFPNKSGWQELPVLTAKSFFPYQMFRCWKHSVFKNKVLILPARTINHLPEETWYNKHQARSKERAEFQGHRPWNSSDSFRQIDWRAKARSGQNLVQVHTVDELDQLNIYWEQTDKLGNHENRLEQMSFWIWQAVLAKRKFKIFHPAISSHSVFSGPQQASDCIKQIFLAENLNGNKNELKI